MMNSRNFAAKCLAGLAITLNTLTAIANHGPIGVMIANGTVQLGVYPEGQLGFGFTNSTSLHFLGTDAEGLYASSEGWGIAALDPANSAVTLAVGYARENFDGVQGISPENFVTTPTTATSTVNVGGVLRVIHAFHPSSPTPNLYQIDISIENISGASARVKYRRVTGWSCQPTPYDNFVTVQAGTALDLVFTSNDGFASANPLAGFTGRGFTGSFIDESLNGIAHGALFDLDFGTLDPGATKSFTAYYGATLTEADADAAVGAVGAEAFSYAQPNIADGADPDADPDGPQYGIPNTFIFALSGIGGGAALPPLLQSVNPIEGGNCSPITLSANGLGFASGATIKLTSSGMDIVGTSPVVSPVGFVISANFDLSVASIGSTWDLVVTNPDLTTATLPGAFTVQSCLAPQIEVQMLGPNRIVPGRTRTFTLSYVNLGNIDAYNVDLAIHNIPVADLTVQIVSTTPTATLSGSASEQIVAFTDPLLPPGQTRFFTISLTANASQPSFDLIGEAVPPFSDSSTLQVDVVASIDPNDKVGVPGVGAGHFISGTETLSYQVFFENQPSATAPAQEVFVTDELDTARLDIHSFSFGPISFGSQTIAPPQGLHAFAKEVYLPLDVDANPSTIDDIIVRIAATLIDNPLDPDFGLVTWSFRSIDPMTGLLPDDPFRGFLPPDITPPEGQGSVLFSVKPRAPLTTGETIVNGANIVFDLNDPIVTPTWVNTIDRSAPESAVISLAATQSSSTFTLNWSGTDAGAGILSYTIFASQDAGPYSEFLSGATATSALFAGQVGSTYRFYSVATDLIGHVEQAPANADATTMIVADQSIQFTGFLAPISGADATGGSFGSPLRAFKLNSAIPIRFSASRSGSAFLSGTHRLELVRYTSPTAASTPIDAISRDATTTGNQFRLTDDQWHFNLDTKATGMSVGIWQLVATLSDGSQHRVWVQLK